MFSDGVPPFKSEGYEVSRRTTQFYNFSFNNIGFYNNLTGWKISPTMILLLPKV